MANAITFLALVFLPLHTVANIHVFARSNTTNFIATRSVLGEIFFDAKKEDDPADIPHHTLRAVERRIDIKREPVKTHTSRFVFVNNISSISLDLIKLSYQSLAKIKLLETAEDKKTEIYAQKIHEIESSIK